MFFVYLNIPQACYTPLIHRTAWAQRTDSLSASSKLHMLFVPNAVVKFPIGTLKGFIGFVKVLQDKWLWKPIFKLCNESWKQLHSLDWLTRWKRVVLTDNLDGSYHKEFIWLYHSFDFWLEWVGKGTESYIIRWTRRTRLWHRQSSKQLPLSHQLSKW